LLNLSLFALNGQWDPVLQLFAIAIIRALCAAGIVWQVARFLPVRGGVLAAVIVAIAFLPHLAWHSVLWGFESQVYFALGFSMLALALLAADELSPARAIAGIAAGGMALLAMGSAALVPVALLGLAGLRAIQRRSVERSLVCLVIGAVVLLGLAVMLRVNVPEHSALRAQTAAQFLAAATQILGWPHVNTPFAAVVVNVPLLIVLARRLLQRRTPWAGEDFVLVAGIWSAAIGLATAWARGGSAELLRYVPSRYVDFVVLLPLANIWCAVALTVEASARWKSSARLLASGWGAFVLMGWLGLSAEVMRGLVLPRARDREAPVRLIRTYQASGNASVFEGQRLLYVPHPNLASVDVVLADRRLKGVLPPSLQPEQPMGPLSRATRILLGHK
jgi:hypothetical protein